MCDCFDGRLAYLETYGYIHPYGPDHHRPAPGDARRPHPEVGQPRAAARLRDRAMDRAGHRRRGPDRGRLALSRAAPPPGDEAADLGVGPCPTAAAASSATPSPSRDARSSGRGQPLAALLDRGVAGARERGRDAGVGATWPSEIARDVDEEIASHLEERREEYAARGLSPGRGGRRRGAEVRQSRRRRGGVPADRPPLSATRKGGPAC